MPQGVFFEGHILFLDPSCLSGCFLATKKGAVLFRNILSAFTFILLVGQKLKGQEKPPPLG